MAQLAARFLKQMVQARFSCNDISLHPCSPALQYDKEEVVIKSAFAPEILRAKHAAVGLFTASSLNRDRHVRENKLFPYK